MCQVWFIGGPWNNRLVRIGNLSSYLRVPIPLETVWDFSDGPILPEPIQSVDYYPDGYLPTGVPVYSCLWGSGGRARPGSFRAQ